jgi:hypothetical protein
MTAVFKGRVTVLHTGMASSFMQSFSLDTLQHHANCWLWFIDIGS